MRLPGIGSTVGQVGYGATAVVVIGLCVWQTIRAARPPALEAVPCLVVCDACGALELDRFVPIRSDGSLELPVTCATCGAEAAALCYNCPSCGEPLAVDPAKPPARCKHCKADLEGMFRRPKPPR